MQITDFDAAPNLVALFLQRADELGEKPFLTAKLGGEWQSLSWREAARQVCLLAEGLRKLGLQDGDRVVLVSENRPEWALADLAIMAAGCITTPAYTTNTERDHAHILENSGARAVVVSDGKLAKPLLSAMVRIGLAEHVIGIEALRTGQGNFRCHLWSDLLQGDAAAARAAVDARVLRIERRDPACIIYTSGTSGAPRGVLLHHGAILRNVDGAARVLAGDFGWGEERFLSFLPLSHALEHTAGLFLPIGLGADIWFAEGLDRLSANIEEARPTFMVVVPRLFEMMRARILKQVESQGKIANFVLDQALSLAERRAAGKGRLSDWAVEKLLDLTLRPKIRKRFGGRIKALVSGGAPLNPEVGAFFEAMGLVMLQGYGQTEAAPVVSVNRPSAGVNLSTVGPPLPGVEVRIADDGEILVRGELVMLGYWQNEAETAKTIVDGWLHTGDIGHFDDAGRIVITDRKKDIIVNDKGDNIAPQKLEGMLTLQPEIAQAMVSGDKRPYIVALIVPDPEWTCEWSQANGEKFDLAGLQQLPAYRSAVRTAIDRVNQDLSVTEKIRQFAFADEGFTIDNGMMTPSMKIRRAPIRDRYGKRLDALYKG
ncbi:AMP-binding protein [Altererythrobacter soli]|uniref:AMP-binding protein n=1 Tax=Croceibacterium soli TaxID=1739690 RepID=A0A6I4URQ5_9SPHN|nr:AMP-dependent synthetase/ligase [Croceibacterium soli]MXP40227.1 AMP-binding protein [Croceibacterium soli]